MFYALDGHHRVVISMLFEKVVETTLAEEIGTWVVMGIFIIGIFEVFAYILALSFYHIIYDKKSEIPDRAGDFSVVLHIVILAQIDK